MPGFTESQNLWRGVGDRAVERSGHFFCVLCLINKIKSLYLNVNDYHYY